jgi:hypothetical protein
LSAGTNLHDKIAAMEPGRASLLVRDPSSAAERVDEGMVASGFTRQPSRVLVELVILAGAVCRERSLPARQRGVPHPG